MNNPAAAQAAAVTPLQAAMLRKIARSLMTEINGAEPETADQTQTWLDDVAESRADGGVVTSLQTAGLVCISGKKRDAVISLTDAGFVAYKAAAKEVPAA